VHSLVSSAGGQLPKIPLSYLPNTCPRPIFIYFSSPHSLSLCSPKSLSSPSPLASSPLTPWSFRFPAPPLPSQNVSFLDRSRTLIQISRSNPSPPLIAWSQEGRDIGNLYTDEPQLKRGTYAILDIVPVPRPHPHPWGQ